MGNRGLFYCLFSVFSNKHHYNFYNKCMWKNVHPVYSARIRIHDVQNTIVLPEPLDQGSFPTALELDSRVILITSGILGS